MFRLFRASPAIAIPWVIAAASVAASIGCGGSSGGATSDSKNQKHVSNRPETEPAKRPATLPATQKLEQFEPESFATLDAAIEAMRTAAREKDPQTMLGIGKWIAEQHKASAIAPLQAIALDKSAAVEDRVAACGALKYVGPAASEALEKTVDAENSLVAANALKSLVMVRPTVPMLVQKLIAWVDHPNLQVQRAAIQSLARIGEKADAAAPKLQAILNDAEANETLRGEAKKALKSVDPRRTFQD